MIDKHLCQRMIDKHDHHHMTHKHDHSMQTLMQQQRTHTLDTICLSFVVFGKVLYQKEVPCFWSTEAPPKTDNDWLFAPAVDDQLTKQTGL